MAGILKYQYSINGTSYQSSNKFTLSSAENYTVYIKAIDKASNQTVVTKSVTIPSYTIYYNSNVLATFDSETIINKSSAQGSHGNNKFKYTTSKEETLYLEANFYAEGSGTIEVISIIDEHGDSYNFNCK